VTARRRIERGNKSVPSLGIEREDPAIRKIFFAARLSRRSSFSVRLARWVIVPPDLEHTKNLPDNVTTNWPIQSGRLDFTFMALR
jgi:hypothetical protein